MSALEQQLEHWPIDRLVEYARNPRNNDHAVDRVAAAIREFGFRVPVVAKSDGTVVDGHLRLKAARKLKLDTVPVLLADDLTDAQIKAFRISVNRMAELADWDEELLALELQDLQDLDFDLELTGFDEDELNRLLGLTEEEPAVDGLTDPDEAPEVQAEAITQPGDVWICGKHRLLCGDSTRLDEVERLLGPGVLVDLLLTDPPYNVAYEGATKDKLTIKNDAMGDEQFRQFLRDAFATADAVMKPGAVFYIWHADTEAYNFRGACRDVGWQVRQGLVWKKSSLVLGRQDYHYQHEPCIYGWKNGAGHLWASDRKQTTILEFDKPARNGEHPTMKPVGLFEYQMLNNTKGADLVLDLFGGSGTTMIAAERHGRQARLLELDPRYADVIVRRWQNHTGKQAILEATGEPFPETPQPGYSWPDVFTQQRKKGA